MNPASIPLLAPLVSAGGHNLPEALDHVLYEMEMLHALPALLEKSPPGIEQNAYLESFIVHARCLNEFFEKKVRDKEGRNMRAVDFVRKFKAISVDDKLIDRMNREINHLGWTRKKAGTRSDGWKRPEVILSLAPQAIEFLEAVARDAGLYSLPDNKVRIDAVLAMFKAANPRMFNIERAFTSSLPTRIVTTSAP